MGVDIGINNLAALASNKTGFVPVVVNGRPVKSVNQFYNKRKAQLQQKLGTTGTTWRMERLTTKRTRRIDHLLHTASRRMIDLLVCEGIGTLIIGKNILWKQECQWRKADKQHFVQLPHARFIDMLTYQAKLVGIKVVVMEESYTSAASFLDLDPMPVYGEVEEEPRFSGRRLKRGLYRAADGREINADVQGASNMIRKVVPNAYVAEGREDGKAALARLVVHPSRTVRLNPQRRESLPILANDPGKAKEACNQ